jgi:hypothetical protein
MPGITALFLTVLAMALHRPPDELKRYSRERVAAGLQLGQ